MPASVIFLLSLLAVIIVAEYVAWMVRRRKKARFRPVDEEQLPRLSGGEAAKFFLILYTIGRCTSHSPEESWSRALVLYRKYVDTFPTWASVGEMIAEMER